MMNIKKFLDEIVRKIESLGYRCELINEENKHCYIYYGNKKLCTLFQNGSISTNEFSDISKMISTVREYLEAFEKAEMLEAEGLREGYKKLLEFNNYVLAMREMSDGNDYEFVTWQYSQDRKAVNIGRYYSDYEAAKENMVFRTGLLDQRKMFSETEMKLIRTSLVSYVGLNSDIDYKAEKAIGAILERIEALVPEIQRHEDYEELDLVSDDELEL